MASLLHTCFSFKVCVVDWQGVSLCVEHPVVQGQHIIFTEQKIEVPGAIRQGWEGRRRTKGRLKKPKWDSKHVQESTASRTVMGPPLASAAMVYGDRFLACLPHSLAESYHPWGKCSKMGWASVLSHSTLALATSKRKSTPRGSKFKS